MGQENKNKYTWEDFVNGKFNSSYYIQLITFFDQLLKIWKADNNTVFVFISRRAFCIFLLMKKQGYLSDWNKIEVYSDRYVMKKLEFDFWNERKIVLIDDSIITGYHLKKTYYMIKRKIENANIIPYVFAAESNWKNPEWRNNDEAFTNLQYSVSYPHNDILKLSSIESLLFYQCGIPYMVELPILTAEEEGLGVSFSKEEFEDLQEGVLGLWTYQECRQVGYLQNEMVSGCLILENNILKRRFSGFIQNLTVRMHILPDEGGVKIIFMPFAVLKSVEFARLESMTKALYKGTKFEKNIVEFERECEKQGRDFKEESFIALYRAVVYSLSCYIGKELRKYISVFYDKNLVVFGGYDQYSFDDDFLESIKQVSAEKLFVQRIFQEKSLKSVKRDRKNEKLYANIPIREYSYNNVYNAMLDMKNQHTLTQKDKETKEELLLSIEEIEEFFRSRCLVSDYEQIDDFVSSCISGMLCQGLLVNVVWYEAEEGIVWRGFSFGENSDVFYSVSAKVFYAGVLIYYERIGEDYDKKYDFFIMSLYHTFKAGNMFGTFISVDEFDLYARYFRNAKDNNQIENKRFLLDEHETPYYIKSVEEAISKLDFG